MAVIYQMFMIKAEQRNLRMKLAGGGFARPEIILIGPRVSMTPAVSLSSAHTAAATTEASARLYG